MNLIRLEKSVRLFLLTYRLYFVFVYFEEADDAEADDEERVGGAVEPLADGAVAARVVVPVGAAAV